MGKTELTIEQRILAAKNEERHTLIEYIKQMQEMHKDNKSVVTTLDFLTDLVRNRMKEKND